MKKTFFIALMAAAMFSSAQSKPATVTQNDGIYLFIDAEPQTPGKYLGTVKVGIVWSDNPKSMRKALLKKAKRKYPSADLFIWKLDRYDELQVYQADKN